MARIDASIYQNQVTPQIFGAIQEGRETALKMSELAKQREDQDKKMAWEAKQQEQAQRKFHQEQAAPHIMNLNPENYESTIAQLKKMGNPAADDLPPVWDPKVVTAYQASAMPVAQQLQQRQYDQEMELKGYTKGANGKWEMVKGGKADISNQTDLAQLAQLKAQTAKTYADAAKERALMGADGSSAGMTPAAYNKKGAEEKGKIGGIVTALETLTNYEKAFDKGDRPEYWDKNTPFVGRFISDTEISKASAKIADDIGRLRSGGAINKDEEARFLGMLPRPGDKEDIARQKMADLRNEFGTRLNSFGVRQEDLGRLGFDQSKLGLKSAAPETREYQGVVYVKQGDSWVPQSQVAKK